LRFDQDAYWGLGIGASIASRVPFVGNTLVHMMLGGPIIAGATLSRFFVFHVFVIPGMLLAFASLHVWMVLKLGINEWPMPGRVVRRSTYLTEYHELTRSDGRPFVPGAVWKDAFFSAAILAAVAICAAGFGPYGPGGQPDPTIIQTAPKPDFFFLWLYAVLSYLPPSLETPFLLIAPVLGIGGLVALPFYAAEELAQTSDRDHHAHDDCHNMGRIYPSRHIHSVESKDECVERWPARSGPLHPRCKSTATARCNRLPVQSMLKLPLHRWSGRPAGACTRSRSNANDGGSIDPAGSAGRRQYAGIWQEPQPLGDNGARAIP
jgi:hypothetical protein